MYIYNQVTVQQCYGQKRKKYFWDHHCTNPFTGHIDIQIYVTLTSPQIHTHTIQHNTHTKCIPHV